jgi:hypothetical protein
VHIELDPILQAAQPWDLSINIANVTHRVRRLTNVDIKRLTDAPKHSDEDNRAFVSGLFETQQPGVGNDWTAEQLAAVLSAVMAYYTQAVLRKNAELVNAAVTKQLRTSAAVNGSGV